MAGRSPLLAKQARLFGTDGVRGKANTELTVDLAVDLGRAAAEGMSGAVVVGRDTRRSGDMLSAALQAGFQSAGVDTYDIGVLPTAAVSTLTAGGGASLGAVVSASHNPAEDNGIKFFGSDGAKLRDDAEDRIEARLRRGAPWTHPTGGSVGMHIEMADALDRYVASLKEGSSYALRGLQVVLDCANGAAFKAAPALFEKLHASVETFAAEPDGTNINLECGATHPEYLARLVNGRIGLAFDGDADRLVAVDEAGEPLDGDVIMAIIARHRLETGAAKRNTVVVTVMSNLGFRRAMDELGINVVETKVGDRYVLEEMRRTGAELGGEQSGHVIFGERPVTGDGLYTGMRLLEVVAASGKPLTELRTVMTRYPQVLRNVRVPHKERLESAENLWAAVQDVTRRLGRDGRVLVRPSGTEPLVRVMVEAPTSHDAAALADELVDVVRAELG